MPTFGHAPTFWHVLDWHSMTSTAFNLRYVKSLPWVAWNLTTQADLAAEMQLIQLDGGG